MVASYRRNVGTKNSPEAVLKLEHARRSGLRRFALKLAPAPLNGRCVLFSVRQRGAGWRGEHVGELAAEIIAAAIVFLVDECDNKAPSQGAKGPTVRGSS